MDKKTNLERQKFQMMKKGLDKIADKVSVSVNVPIKENVFTAGDFVENFLKTIKGDKGDSPTREEIITLIKPLIIQPKDGKDGHTPTDKELIALIKPLISKVKDGKTPTDKELLILIKTLIPEIQQIDTNKIVLDASLLATEKIKKLIPETEPIESIIKKLQGVKKQWVDIEQIKGDFNSKVTRVIQQLGTSSGLKGDPLVVENLQINKRFYNNSIVTITGTTPSVLTGNQFRTNNTELTQISNFADGKIGQIIWVEAGDVYTVVEHGDNLNLQGGVNYGMQLNDTIAFIYNGTKWLETGRGGTGGGGTPGGGNTMVQYNKNGSFSGDSGLVYNDSTNVLTAGNLSGTNTGDQDLSGYELLSHKATNFTTINDTLYPSIKAVNDAITSAVVGLLDYRGSYSASTNLYPSTGGSGTSGAILKGDFWIISVAGTLGGNVVSIGDMVIALVDTPAQTSTNWNIIEYGLSYIPENQANKENTTIDTSTTKYPTVNLLKTGLDTKVIANTAITGATKTKITYDSKGLVTAGADATTADIADSTDKRYCTDAQKTIIGNTSNTNTGDGAVDANGNFTKNLTGAGANLTLNQMSEPGQIGGTAYNSGGDIEGPVTYYYVITATNINGETLKGTQSTAKTIGAGIYNGRVVLTWSQVAGATGYKIYRTTTSGTYTTPSLKTTITSGTTLTYTDTSMSILVGAPPSTNSTGAVLTLNSTGAGKIVDFQNSGSSVFSILGNNVGIGNITPTSILHTNGAIATPISTKTATYTMTANDDTILANTATAFTINLPTVVGITGRSYTFIKISSDANALTLDPAGTETINNATTKTLTAQYARCKVVANGTNWYILNE